MKVYTEPTNKELDAELKSFLNSLRDTRGFQAEEFLEDKIKTIDAYFGEQSLDTAVIGISGGIDSAVCLAILSQPGYKNLKTIVPVFLPVSGKGMTNREEAEAKAEAVCDALGHKLVSIDLTASHNILKQTVDDSLGLLGEDWANGQLVSYIRTPTFYYITSLLNEAGHSPIVCGTINRDEGAYLGFLGKAGDGMVDVQLISDLHKSEVRSLANLLNVPKEIIAAQPTGDMYDSRVDEDVFGASYDFVELYLNFLCLPRGQQESIRREWPISTQEKFNLFQRNLEELHTYNNHKYLGDSPAVHLNILQSRVPEG